MLDIWMSSIARAGGIEAPLRRIDAEPQSSLRSRLVGISGRYDLLAWLRQTRRACAGSASLQPQRNPG